MENTALVLIGAALFLLVIVVGLLSVLIYKLFQDKTNNSRTNLGPEYHPEIIDRMRDLEIVKSKRLDLFCPNHSEEPGEVTCSICDKIFCKICIRPFKSLHFCKEHLPLIMKHEWDEVLTIKTSTTDPEQGVRLFDIKKKIFEQNELPTYIETHYKINVDQDYIETYLVLFGIKEKISELKQKLNEFL